MSFKKEITDVFMEATLSTIKGRAAVSVSSSGKEIVLYLAINDKATVGDDLSKGRVSFAFLSSKPISKLGVGDKLIGRKMSSAKVSKFAAITTGLKIGRLDILGTIKGGKEDFEFWTDVLPGHWNITAKRKMFVMTKTQ